MYYYCNISPIHTLCLNDGPGIHCGSHVPHRGVSEEDRRFILDRHNQLRSRVAQGLELQGINGPQPSAADMNCLVIFFL